VNVSKKAARAMQGTWWSRGIAPMILDLGAKDR